MTKDLLLEIGVEELPADYMSTIIPQLKDRAKEKFAEKRIMVGNINVYATPRRLIIHGQDIALKQADAIIENRGPKKAIAFDEQGEPTKATLGFAKAQKVAVKDLEIREVSGIDYIFAVKTEQGEETIHLLPQLLADLIQNLSFPKSMRWGDYKLRFARPIRWILAMLGEEIVEFQLENITSSNITYGHRFLSGELEVPSVEAYFKLLEDNYVIYDQAQRKAMIKRQIKEVAEKAGGLPLENDKLLDEVTYLVEYPTAFYGEFSPSYLDVPVEVLTTSMIEHQRYFPIFDEKDNLLNGFIGIRNGTNYNIDVVKLGNERVLKARLEDALFFWQEDTKFPLERMIDKLDEVLFHEKLGSILDKVKRIEQLALYIGDTYSLGGKDKTSRAARLCKADLVSNMVYEFPELQGIMGRYYAQQSKEDGEVATAIYEHYLPRFAGDILPTTTTGILLSLAEKIDNLVAFFAIGIKPTGSQDPYALRRQAIGLVNILLEKDLNLDLPAILQYSYQTLVGVQTSSDNATTVSEVFDFVLQRLKGVILEGDISHDTVEAILAVPHNNINEIVLKTEVLTEFKAMPSFADFMVVFNRANNLSKKWDSNVVTAGILEDESEIELYSAFNNIKDEVGNLFAACEYQAALDTIADLRPKIDDFFDKVMVMVEDEELKAARLSLLKAIAELCLKFADFNKTII